MVIIAVPPLAPPSPRQAPAAYAERVQRLVEEQDRAGLQALLGDSQFRASASQTTKEKAAAALRDAQEAQWRAWQTKFDARAAHKRQEDLKCENKRMIKPIRSDATIEEARRLRENPEAFLRVPDTMPSS